MSEKITYLKPKRKCPICKRQAVNKYHPFCSNRCANIDLNRWLSDAYIIPGEKKESEEKISD